MITLSREYTTEEIREQFLDNVRMLVNYWDRTPKETTKEKLEGLAFSILTILDGCAGDLPGFIVAPSSHPDDKQYHIDNEENYYPENHEIEDKIKGDIAGGLHESFYRK